MGLLDIVNLFKKKEPLPEHLTSKEDSHFEKQPTVNTVFDYQDNLDDFIQQTKSLGKRYHVSKRKKDIRRYKTMMKKPLAEAMKIMKKRGYYDPRDFGQKIP